VAWLNLTAPDRLNVGFSINLPIIGHPDGLPVLTILMGVTMFLQQKMTPSREARFIRNTKVPAVPTNNL
jgi:YidC/Oxa1 family membrane protein insertase